MTPQRQKRHSRPAAPVPQTFRQRCLIAYGDYVSKGTLLRDHPILEERSAEAAQATTLAAVMIQRQRTVNQVLKVCCSRQQHDVQPQLWTILQQGTAELLFGQQEADHAVINETVDLCHWLKQPRWTGFCNGVLRQVQRIRLEKQPLESPTSDAIPISMSQQWKLKESIFSDPDHDWAAFLSQCCSLPKELAVAWETAYGKEASWQLGLQANTTTQLMLRLNRLRTTSEEYLPRLQELGWQYDSVTLSAGDGSLSSATNEMIRLHGTPAISAIPGLMQGDCSVQDSTAAKAVLMLDPKSGEAVLDLCSAPGTKTVQIAELMGDEGRILACDITQSRLGKVTENVIRCGLKSIETQLIDKADIQIEGKFDAVIVDAPCSNTGVLSKRPEARWRYSENDIQELQTIQHQLLNLAAAVAKPAGRIVYATCSIDPAENEIQVNAWLAENPDWKLKQLELTLPSLGCDGGCAALMVREG